MPESEAISRDSHSVTGHPLPRRTSPAHSVTLKHHRLARGASLRASAGSGPTANTNSNTSPSARRNSSGESHDTGQSDPTKWFDQSNQNPTATFDNTTMDVDPPFFQKESDSSNEDKPFHFQREETSAPRLWPAHSSSADDYRSVIDDLTVEIKKLKEELKRHKQNGPELLRKDKLFEIKIHGLPNRKKRELESTLRDFAASLHGSPDTSSLNPRSKSRHATRDHMYSGSMSKHASSSSGSNRRPVDSAYASASTGAHSSGASLGRESASVRASASAQKVESFLRDIPEGLYPRQTVMTDKEKKRLVVRRLERFFTGKIAGRGIARPQPPLHTATSNVDSLAPVISEGQGQQNSTLHQPPLLGGEPAREAQMLRFHQQPGSEHKKPRSRGTQSAPTSHDDNAEGNGSSGTSTSSPQTPPLEQRPTRPKDLDPDRVQVPSENMDYIKHLGLVPPELLGNAELPTQEAAHDAEGWVYLNLLCSLAQLHIINVTPAFVRTAVSEISSKLQLSSDGRKMRWRGGREGTRFASESSGANSQREVDTEDTDGSTNKGRKRQRTGPSTGDDTRSGGNSSKNMSKLGLHNSHSSDSFHYKPMFVRQDSYNGGSSPEDTLSSFGPIEESNIGESGYGQSGSGTSNRRKRRRDGAIMYYNGASFCTDLSGDPGNVSPTANLQSGHLVRPVTLRTGSGSSLTYRPLSDKPQLSGKMDVDTDPGLTTDTGDESEVDIDTSWSNDQQFIEVRPLEPCGLGGVLPDDHFMVVVTTARPKSVVSDEVEPMSNPDETTDGIVKRLASMSTRTGVLPSASSLTPPEWLPVEITYTSGRIKRLAPVALPPPAIFFPPFSTNSSYSMDDDRSEDVDDETSEESNSYRANPHQSDDYPDGVDLTSGDEDGEDPDNEPDSRMMYDATAAPKDPQGDEDMRSESTTSAQAAAGTAPRGRSKSVVSEFSSSDDES